MLINNPSLPHIPLDAFRYIVEYVRLCGHVGPRRQAAPPSCQCCAKRFPRRESPTCPPRFHTSIVQARSSAKDVRVEVALGNSPSVDFLRERGVRGHYRSEESAAVVRKIKAAREVE